MEKLHRLPEECGEITLEGLEEAFEEYVIQREPKGKRKPSATGQRTEVQLRALGLMPKPETKQADAQRRR